MRLNPIAPSLDSDISTQSHGLFPDLSPAVRLDKDAVEIQGHEISRVTGEFWTSGQRRASSLHEISYRACFKPHLPAYFIKRFSHEGDFVYDPFSGRGTTAIEAALWGRNVIANDANPLSAILAKPRLSIPRLAGIEDRLKNIPMERTLRADIGLSMFYHHETESEIVSLKNYLKSRKDSGKEDSIDAWIRMAATNRLTGHSPGFFSVYTFPPNQAVSQSSQIKINEKRKQAPVYRNTRAIILKKSSQLLKNLDERQLSRLHSAASQAIFLTGDARSAPSIPDSFVQLTVTSPPFLDIVQYASDNWLRCWFNSLQTGQIASNITTARTIERWSEIMGLVFAELFRITKPEGFVAFEVGEIRKGKMKLEEFVAPLGLSAGFTCEAILINNQDFTKTANIWGVKNNRQGTNSNRIVLFRKH